MTFHVVTKSLAALREVAAGVTEDQLRLATPCEQWTVAQVLLHAAADQHGWAATVGTAALPGYDPFAPPQDVDRGVGAAVDSAVDVATETWADVDASADAVSTPLPPFPEMTPSDPAATAALDAVVHPWDVAVATGQPSPLTPALADQVLPAARTIAEPLRGFAFGPALEPQAGDNEPATLLRLLGRDPAWG
ncbi:MAG: TIGR03086 family metal-binding protein [Nocardioidaceae bacterium]